MYTDLKSYQIIISLLKKWNIRHCVLSAGSRNVPFVHSVEEDPFFECYSVVDERSAGYFALGLSQQLHVPVVISCTASTASCNYWPPVAEAFYQGVPLIVLTSDRDVAMLKQWEDQMIDQVDMFDRHVRKSVNLPEVNDERDWIYCQRLVNEALLELNHNGSGPVHINIPMEKYSLSFNTSELPQVTKIDRVNIFNKIEWEQKVEQLKTAKRILVTCGQNSYVQKELEYELTEFFKKFNVCISLDHMSNIQSEGALNTSVCFDVRYCTHEKFKDFIPDIVISFGYNICQGLKEFLREYHGHFEHWLIQPDGRVIDMYKSLTTIFECPIDYFFKQCNKLAYKEATNDFIYYNEIKDYINKIVYPAFPYCSTYVIQQVIERIPSGSILHLAINNAIRIANFFRTSQSVKAYANIGTYGIDGCLSTFLGQSVTTEVLSFLIIGDLAFFYDMNALRIKHIGKNVRILLINNEGGSEFYYNGTWRDSYSDLHTTARHHTKAEGWVRESNFLYIGIHNKEELETALPIFFDTTLSQSVFMEVFTEMKDDAEKEIDFYNLSRPVSSMTIREKVNNVLKAVIGEDNVSAIKKVLKK